MKAALTIWDGRISPVFDVSRQALILTIEDGAMASRRCESIDAQNPSAKIDQLLALGVRTLVCGAISRPLHRELTDRGVTVIAFVAGQVDDVVASFLAGKLPTAELSMPGCLRKRQRFGADGGRPGGGGGRRRGQGRT